MAASEELEMLAAEYVLGTLDGSERRAAETALAGDPGLAAAIAGWERRLSPLALALEPVTAPPHLRSLVMQRVAAPAGGNDTVVVLQSRLRRWRWATLAAGALAAALAGVMVLGPATPPAERYVAVLQAEGPGPAFLASVDIAHGTISVRPVAAAKQQGKSYELWALGAGRARPQSLGVIDAAFRIPAARLGATDRAALGDTVFAVSLEPEGGSPTGQPTGPVLFTGKLVATGD